MNAKGSESELATVAGRLEAELGRFEALVALTNKSAIDSKKTLERAARAFADAVSSRDRVLTEVGHLAAAVASARDRQQTTGDLLQARALQLKDRAAVIASFFERFGAVGEDARKINELLQQASSEYREDERPTAEAVARFADLHTRMSEIAQKATELAEEALQAGVLDIAHQADSVRQQVYAARNRLGLLQRGHSTRSSDPS
jgi:hypothetical protein